MVKMVMSEKSSIQFQAAIACLLWSSAFVGVKVGLAYTSPFLLAGLRCLFAGIILIPFTGKIKSNLKIIWKNRRLVLTLAGLQTVIMYGLYFTGINLLPSAVAALIIGAAPLVTAILTHLHMKNDRMSKKKLLTIAFGIAGIVFVISGRQTFEFAGYKDLIGAFLLIINMVGASYSSIVVAKSSGTMNPVLLNSSQLTIGGIVLILMAFLFESPLSIELNMNFIMALSWISFLSAAAFSIWFSILNKPDIRVSELDMWKFFIPVFGAILSWIILPDESPTIISITGMIIITASIVFYYLPGRNSKEIENI
jgi:drug/metabolite transporter (DMT)-like permease